MSEPTPPVPSAADLPTFAEMLRNLSYMRKVTRFIGRGQRAQILQLERDIQELIANVDSFYGKLGTRNWVYHSKLEISFVNGLIELPIDEAEARLVALYNGENLRRWIVGLSHFDEFRERATLLEFARIDHVEGRYYSSVQLLLSTMDGFVNEFDPRERRGLHAREADEMAGWDSVISHHMGLAHAHQTFVKGFHKTLSEEVHELYRNGIVHGNIIHYNNPVVGSKAWNRLFAIADWAESLRRKEKHQPERDVSWKDLWHQLHENARAKTALANWKASWLRAEDSSFNEDEVVQRSTSFLALWVRRNYGEMAGFVSPLTLPQSNRAPAMIRAAFAAHQLEDFTLESVRYSAAAVAIATVRLRVAGTDTSGRLRWARQDSKGTPVAPNQAGTWLLMSWGAAAIIAGSEP